MKVLSVVTLVTPDGAYGGPVRVAVNQATALRSRGHEVSLTSAVRGFAELPTHVGGVPLHAFHAHQIVPGIGFAGLAAPRMLAWCQRHADEFDVVHVHLARDFVTLPVAAMFRRRRARLVLQTHGMIDPSSRLLSRPLDAVLTRRVLREAASTLFLTDRERSDLVEVEPRVRGLTQLENGVPNRTVAHDAPPRREVLFLARLQDRKRPMAFIEAITPLLPRFPDWQFRLVGPDEGEGGATAKAIRELDTPQLAWEGPVASDQAQERLARAAVYVLPSINEPFPMSVLEAMAASVPVVVTHSCGLAPDIGSSEAGLVVDHSVEALRAAVLRLMESPELRARLGANGLALSRNRFAMENVARRLESVYAEDGPGTVPPYSAGTPAGFPPASSGKTCESDI